MAALVILVVIVLLAGLVAVVTSVLGIPITFGRKAQRSAKPAPTGPPSGTARASVRLFLAIVVIAVTGAALATLALRWLSALLERLSA